MTRTSIINEMPTAEVNKRLSGITGYTLTNHVYTILLGIKVGEDVTAGDVLNNLREKIGEISAKITTELENFKNILKSKNPIIEIDNLDSVLTLIDNQKWI